MRDCVLRFLLVVGVGLVVGLAYCGISWTMMGDSHPDDRVALVIPIMLIATGTSALIGLLTGFAMWLRDDLSLYRSITKIAGAGVAGFLVGGAIDSNYGSAWPYSCSLFAMIAAAVLIRLIGDKWIALGGFRQQAEKDATN